METAGSCRWLHRCKAFWKGCPPLFWWIRNCKHSHSGHHIDRNNSFDRCLNFRPNMTHLCSSSTTMELFCCFCALNVKPRWSGLRLYTFKQKLLQLFAVGQPFHMIPMIPCISMVASCKRMAPRLCYPCQILQVCGACSMASWYTWRRQAQPHLLFGGTKPPSWINESETKISESSGGVVQCRPFDI